MAAPCDPAPENAIIVVCAIYVDPDPSRDSAERIFPGAPCWYTAAPATRKRARFEIEKEDDPTFVTTVYPTTGTRVLAGICIGHPQHDRYGVITVGVAISGAITIARPKPREGEPALVNPDPGHEAFFDGEGKIEFRAPAEVSTELRRELIPFLRAMSEGGRLTSKSIASIVALWSPLLTTFDEEETALRATLDATQFQKNLSVAFAGRLADLNVDPTQVVTDAIEDAFEAGEDLPAQRPANLDGCTQYLIPVAAAKCIRLLGLTSTPAEVANELRALRGENFSEFTLTTGLRRPWARVLDTGGNHEVRVLLKLV